MADKLHIKDTDSPGVQKAVRLLAKVSEPLLKHVIPMLEGGIHIGKGNVTDFDKMGYLRDIRPGGYSELTFKDLPGVYMPSSKKLVAGTGPEDKANIILHEFGHAVGHLMGVDSSEEWKAIHANNQKRLKKMSRVKWFMHEGHGGMSETFAEAFSDIVAYPLAGRERWGKEISDYIKKVLAFKRNES